MKDTLVIYHKNCLDGFGAAYAAWKRLGNDAEYVAAQYGDEPPKVKDKDVFILDFSYPRDVLIRMADDANCLVVLDHHKTAEKELSGLCFATFDMNRSGCVMAWQHFFSGPVPEALLLIQDRDLWRFELELTREFNAALYELVEWTFEAWDKAFKDINMLTRQGWALNLSFNNYIEVLIERSYLGVLNDIKVVCCNANIKYTSELGNRLAEHYQLPAVIYSYDGKNGHWNYGLRSVGDVDVSLIAKEFGGGGHKNAAGFVSDILLV